MPRSGNVKSKRVRKSLNGKIKFEKIQISRIRKRAGKLYRNARNIMSSSCNTYKNQVAILCHSICHSECKREKEGMRG
jgi:hypothetical protein